jgi:hypothetical protein
MKGLKCNLKTFERNNIRDDYGSDSNSDTNSTGMTAMPTHSKGWIGSLFTVGLFYLSLILCILTLLLIPLTVLHFCVGLDL